MRRLLVLQRRRALLQALDLAAHGRQLALQTLDAAVQLPHHLVEVAHGLLQEGQLHLEVLHPSLHRVLPLAAVLVACSGPACPTGTHADAPRTARILAQLDAWGQPRPSGSLCWVDQPPSGVLPDGRLRLERDLGDVAAAARAAHLTRHVGQAPLEADAPCEPQVASWIAAEGRAWALEVALRQRAGLPAELPFEVQARAAADPAATIEAWLWAHPDGSDGIDGIVAGYRARCR